MSKDNFSRILPKNQVEISYIKYCLQYQVSIEEILREGKELYKVTAKTLLKIRNETFDQFWKNSLDVRVVKNCLEKVNLVDL